jgi:hypothetical protein
MRSFSKKTMINHHQLFANSLILMSAMCFDSARGDELLGENASSAPAAINLEPSAPEFKNRIGLSYRMGLNIAVDFKKLGGLGLSNPGAATGGAVNRNYDNGYNRVDSSGNAGNQTWYWGYSSPQSVQGGNLVLQSYSTPANATSYNQQGDPQHGFEINYQRELYRKPHWRFGAEAAFGYSLITIDDNSTLHNRVYRTNDTFALSGVIPPNSPYNGTFEGPGPVISSEPSSRSTDVLTGAATITGDRHLDGQLFLVRLGPYLEVPLSERFSLFINGGLTLGAGYTKFSFNENVEISDPTYGVTLTSGHRSGSGSETDFIIGGYGGAGVSYALTEQVGVFASAIYQAAGQVTNSEHGKESVLNLGKSILVSVGVSYSF